LVYTFNIRRGVRFHNGRELKADDFRYSFERVLNPKTKSERVWVFEKIKGAKEFNKGEAMAVSGIEVLDDYTLRLTLEKGFPPFLSVMTYNSANVVPREEVERWGEDFTSHPVGTGPFKFVEWVHDDHVTVEKFDDYWKGRPYLDRIIFRVIPEEATRFEEYKAGNLEHVDIPSGQFMQVKADMVLSKELREWAILGTYYIGFNMTKEPFGGRDWNSENKRKLRQAMNYAIDRDAIINVILEGRGIKAAGVLPPLMPGYNPKLQGYSYDPERARTLLREAGYADGRGLPPITLYHNTSETHRKVMELIQAQLAQIGVRVEVRSMDWAAYLKALDVGEFQMFRLGWIADYPDPENFLTVLLHGRNSGAGGNAAFYNNPVVNQALDRADNTVVWREREAFYRHAEELISRDAPWIPIYHYFSTVLVKPYVKGVKLSAMDTSTNWLVQPLEEIWLDR
jgi:peptide/nickel transport system substrate-binding protein/oligopeptide transport system substrate-binding protein